MKRILCLVLFLLIGCYQSTLINDHSNEMSCDEIYDENHLNQQLQFPIDLYINPSMSDDDIEITILASVAWNTTMSASIFTPIVSDRSTDWNDCGSVFVKTGDLSRNYVGYAWWDSCSAQIIIEPDQEYNIAMIVMIHELGHSLNLDHEDNMSSVMHNGPREDQVISDLSQCLVGRALREGSINADL